MKKLKPKSEDLFEPVKNYRSKVNMRDTVKTSTSAKETSEVDMSSENDSSSEEVMDHKTCVEIVENASFFAKRHYEDFFSGVVKLNNTGKSLLSWKKAKDNWNQETDLSKFFRTSGTNKYKVMFLKYQGEQLVYWLCKYELFLTGKFIRDDKVEEILFNDQKRYLSDVFDFIQKNVRHLTRYQVIYSLEQYYTYFVKVTNDPEDVETFLPSDLETRKFVEELGFYFGVIAILYHNFNKRNKTILVDELIKIFPSNRTLLGFSDLMKNVTNHCNYDANFK